MDPAHSALDEGLPAISQVVLFSLAMVGALAEHVPTCPLLQNPRFLWRNLICILQIFHKTLRLLSWHGKLKGAAVKLW